MTTRIGPFGHLVEVRSPGRPLPADIVRPSSTTTLLSGAVRSQRAPASSRRWTWNLPWGDSTDLSGLVALEQGVLGPPPWRWYDPMAAHTNMLPPAAAVPGLGGDLTYLDGTVENAGAMTVDGVRLAWSVSGDFTVPALDSDPDPVPVIEGRSYTASAYLDGAGTVTLKWVDDSGSEVSTVDASGSDRVSVTEEAPSGAAGALVTVADATRTSGLQLTEGPLVGWFPGQGIPRVTIAGLGQIYRLVTGDSQRRDVTVDLVEVGGGGMSTPPTDIYYGGAYSEES